MKQRKLPMKKLIIFYIMVSFFAVTLFMTIGSADISVADVVKIVFNRLPLVGEGISIDGIPETHRYIILFVRLPRIIAAFVAGFGLSIAGVAYQSVFQNPMADPYIIGVSSGAALGAAVGIVSGITFNILGVDGIGFFSFVFSLLAVSAVYKISNRQQFLHKNIMLLSGIAIGQICSALLTLIMVFYAKDLQKISFWTMGSFSGKTWISFGKVIPAVVITFLLLKGLSRELNLMMLGDEQASNLGLDVSFMRKLILGIATLLTSIIVSQNGTIGFVGLIVPHVSRLIFGPNNNRLVISSGFMGGIFLSFCDTVARTIASPMEIPIGAITALFGAPFFVYLLIRRQKETR